MSDVGKLQRPEAASLEAAELGDQPLPGSALQDPATERGRAADELQFRASGGARGVAPMQRLIDERRAVGSRLAARVQRKAEGGAAGNVQVPQGSGAKLPSQVRQRMEPRLGADLSDVQVHTGGESAQAAQGLGARAFTVGSDVHFGAGEFAPGSKEGDRLIAHELTHVVQGKKSGVQRKADEGAAGGAGGAGGGGEHGAAEHGGEGGASAHGGAEVSQPNEPAEKEADAVADGVADSLHGDKKDAKGKGKDKDKAKEKDKDKAKEGGADAHGDDGHGPDAHGGGAGAHETAAHGGNHEGAAHAGGGQNAGAPAQEKPAPISAKLVGVGRKIFRAPGPAAAKPAPAPGAKPADKTADPKQAGIEKAKACKTDADVDAFCAADPIATQKLADVKGETNLETDNGAAKSAFYKKMATWIQSNAETVNPKTIFNQCMNSLASDWKFKGKKLDIAKLPKALQRTQGLRGFYHTAVNKAFYEAKAAGAPDPGNVAYALWKKEAETNPLAQPNGGTIMAQGGTWFTPDSYKLGNASDAGFQQLLELAALQPEWFPEGNIVFDVDVATAKGSMEARRPTAYDGMQSSLWVSRPTGETYGVTGGGANEFLAGKVPVASVKNARMVAPADDTKTQLSDAMKAATEQALNADPDLKKRLEDAGAAEKANKDPAMAEKLKKARDDLKNMIPNLTDMFLRGNAPGSIGDSVKQMLDAIRKSTESQRKDPSPTRAPGEIEAPSVKAAGGGAPVAGGSSKSGAGASAAAPTNPAAKGGKKS